MRLELTNEQAILLHNTINNLYPDYHFQTDLKLVSVSQSTFTDNQVRLFAHLFVQLGIAKIFQNSVPLDTLIQPLAEDTAYDVMKYTEDLVRLEKLGLFTIEDSYLKLSANAYLSTIMPSPKTEMSTANEHYTSTHPLANLPNPQPIIFSNPETSVFAASKEKAPLFKYKRRRSRDNNLEKKERFSNNSSNFNPETIMATATEEQKKRLEDEFAQIRSKNNEYARLFRQRQKEKVLKLGEKKPHLENENHTIKTESCNHPNAEADKTEKRMTPNK